MKKSSHIWYERKNEKYKPGRDKELKLVNNLLKNIDGEDMQVYGMLQKDSERTKTKN